MNLRFPAVLLLVGLGFTVYRHGWPVAIDGITMNRNGASRGSHVSGMISTGARVTLADHVTGSGYTLVEFSATW